jgi:hypothetical protein
MDNKNSQPAEKPDFTSKGRTSNPENMQVPEGEKADISNIDQQEGELNHGTIGSDPELFSNGQQTGTSS